MSITLGVYDLFSFTVPGLLYLYVANEFLKLFGLKHIELQQLNEVGVAVLMVAIGYILGQILEMPAKAWRRWRQPTLSPDAAIAKVNRDFPKRKISFSRHDWPFLLGLIRRNHPEAAVTIDRNSAIGIMLQNASLGFLLYTLLQLMIFIFQGFSVNALITAIIAFIVALMAKRKSQTYNQWFYDSIYETALTYGDDTNTIITRVQSGKPTK